MIGYTRKVGLRKPGTFEWARSQIPPDSDGLAEWIAYQEGVLNQDQVESLRQWWHGYETRSIVEIEPSPDIDQYDQGGLLEPISRTFNAYATPEPVDPATCFHCCCTYTTECCYCDGSRTPLEDS